MLETIVLICVTALVTAITLWLRPPPCPGCGSRYSAWILLPDAVVCAGCWKTLA